MICGAAGIHCRYYGTTVANVEGDCVNSQRGYHAILARGFGNAASLSGRSNATISGMQCAAFGEPSLTVNAPVFLCSQRHAALLEPRTRVIRSWCEA